MPFVRLHAHHQAIGRNAVGCIVEYDMRHAAEADDDFRKALRQPFAGAQVEGHARPAPVGDAELERHESLGVALLLADVLQVAGNRAAVGEAGAILAAHRQRRGVGFVDRLQRFQHLQLLVAQGVRLERIRRLHGDEAEELHHMVLHHVADRARFFIVAAAPFDAERFGDGDLHVIDVRVIPKRLEQDVGEAQRHQVLHRFLAEIVVDAENIALEEHRADRRR